MLKLVKENLISIIFSILTSIITILITDWIKKKGNLKFYIIDYKEMYYKYDKTARRNIEEKEFTDDTNYVTIIAIIDICNITSFQKIMRNIKFEVDATNKVVVFDKSVENIDNKTYNLDELETLNISPLSVVRKIIEINLSRDNYCNNKNYYLTYRNNSNKLRKVKLKK